MQFRGAPMPLDRVKAEKAAAKDFGTEGNASEQTGTSVFDPVLCEMAYRWFCPPKGQVLDPFAGGSVRGIVAGVLGYRYYGIDLSERQIAANKLQRTEIVPKAKIEWIYGNSLNCLDKAPAADFVFSCPPYGDLEVYSDDPADLSTMNYADFMECYKKIISLCYGKLRDNRFACFVVGEYRDKKSGNYHSFVPDTINAFKACGFEYYNEAILVTAVGSLPVRVGKQFTSGRKIGKTHQNVLIFVKGDGIKATKECGDIEVFIPENQAG